MEENKQAPEHKPSPPSAQKELFQSGEKGFAVFWLLFGLYFFYQSILLYRDHPGLSSSGAIPLFVTGVIVVCALAILVIDRRQPTHASLLPPAGKARATLRYMFPADVSFMLAAIFCYCLALYFRLGFYPATALFLWVSMTFFMRGKYREGGQFQGRVFASIALRNVLWTALSLAFVLVVFTFLFRVVLP